MIDELKFARDTPMIKLTMDRVRVIDVANSAE